MLTLRFGHLSKSSVRGRRGEGKKVFGFVRAREGAAGSASTIRNLTAGQTSGEPWRISRDLSLQRARSSSQFYENDRPRPPKKLRPIVTFAVLIMRGPSPRKHRKRKWVTPPALHSFGDEHGRKSKYQVPGHRRRFRFRRVFSTPTAHSETTRDRTHGGPRRQYRGLQ